MKSFSARILAVVAVLSLIGNVLLYMRYSTGRPLVTVGSDVITKRQYQDQLEFQLGKQVLTKMVSDKLVDQAAAKEKVSATTADVDDRVKYIARRAPQILAPYSLDPVKMATFRQDLQTGIALENLRIKDVALTPKQVADFYDQHKNLFAEPQQTETTTIVTDNNVDAATATDLLTQKTPVDVISRHPRLRVVGVNNFNPPMSQLPQDLTRQINSWVANAKVGAVKTFQYTSEDKKQTLFFSFRITKVNPATTPSYSQIRPSVERMARLAKAPSSDVELARLYQAAKPTFNAEKYSVYFKDLQDYNPANDEAKKTASAHPSGN